MYITRLNGYNAEATVQFAQRMTAEIAHQLGIKEMAIYHYNPAGESRDSLNGRLDGIIAGIAPGEIVFYQYPSWNGLNFDERLMTILQAYGARLVIFVHDIETLMFSSPRHPLPDVAMLLNRAELLILPSRNMHELLMENGLDRKKRVLYQQLWDYTTEPIRQGHPAFKKELHFAGSPGQLPVKNRWDYDLPINIYSGTFCAGEQVNNRGWLYRPQLLTAISEGGFGLSWYEDGVWKDYIRYNCCMKTSTYLAAGIPVVVQKGSSVQALLEEHNLGFGAETIEEAISRIQNMTEAEYRDMTEHVEKYAFLIRNGFITKKLLVDSIVALQQ